jgi:hypothetical protein
MSLSFDRDDNSVVGKDLLWAKICCGQRSVVGKKKVAHVSWDERGPLVFNPRAAVYFARAVAGVKGVVW